MECQECEFEENDYSNVNGIISRCNPKEVASRDKMKLLRKALTHFTGGLLPKLYDFEFEGEVNDDSEEKNCICSHRIRNAFHIRHKPSQTTFLIGSHCFETLYGKAECDEIYIFKPYCMNCKSEKVKSKRSNAGKEGFCSNKCMNIYAKKFACQDCGKRFWRRHPSHKYCVACYRRNTYYGHIANRGYLIQ